MPANLMGQVMRENNTAQHHNGPSLYLRDGVHSGIILEFGFLLAVLAVAIWIRFRQITTGGGGVRCPHCVSLYDEDS